MEQKTVYIREMKYISTRGQVDPVGFSEAVMTGLAPDGGLLLPESIPDVRNRIGDWWTMSYQRLAAEIMRPFVDLSGDALHAILERSYSVFDNAEVAPIAAVGPVYMLELFHGPTLAFKDVALQFLGNLFEHILGEAGGRLNVLCATSGDTGSASIQGLRGKTGMSIFVMHPHNRISRIQELQMTSVLDRNVFNIAVEGNFDDCQAVMKAVFNDLPFKRLYSLGSVNSINWARVAAQIVYYFYGAFRVMDVTGAGHVNFCVPTGNFGDIFAGYLAARMGLPVRQLILATNENDILTRFFRTGRYSKGEVHATLSPSMDIQVASNFERYLYYCLGGDAARLRKLMDNFAEKGELTIDTRGEGVDPLFTAKACNRAETLRTIRKFYDEYDYLIDPHTATGVFASETAPDDSPTVCLATAHPAKFPDAVAEAIGSDAARHASIDALAGKPVRCDVLPASVDAVRAYIRERIADL